MTDIPRMYLDAIERGQCSLFLGAGASKAASGPTGDELSRGVAREVLGVKWDLPLDRCISLARAQKLEPKAHRHIVEAVKDLKLSDSHRSLPSYPWRAIVTTNYDELVERAFRGTGGPQLVPILDAADLGNLQPMALPYLKLHGCISRQDRMVASTEDLYDLRRERQPLVSYIESLHLMGPVIYVGYSFRDTHIIDLIFDLNRRLGRSRQPFLFVGHESDPQRAQLEGDWFRQELQGHYLPVGFEQFMSQLAVELRSFNRTSRLIGALAPCRAEAFWVQADAEIDLKETKGNVECWLTYKIRRREGFAGVNLVPARGAADLSSYSQLTFELNIGDEPRQVAQIEALNMRDIGSKMHFNIVGVAKMRGQGWYSVKCDLGRYTEVNMRCIDRVALADNGSRAKLNRRYRVGLRNVRLEK